jgi:hypothetical protein
VKVGLSDIVLGNLNNFIFDKKTPIMSDNLKTRYLRRIEQWGTYHYEAFVMKGIVKLFVSEIRLLNHKKQHSIFGFDVFVFK